MPRRPSKSSCLICTRLFESMLGRNMVNALPENVKGEYLRMAEDLQNLDYEKIGAVFDAHIPDYQGIMKATMKQFARDLPQQQAIQARGLPGNVAELARCGLNCYVVPTVN